MIRLICVCCALLVGEFSYGMSPGEADQEYRKISQIGKPSEDGTSVLLTSELARKYAEEHRDELFAIPEKILRDICFGLAGDTKSGEKVLENFMEKPGKLGRKGIIYLTLLDLVPLLEMGTVFECIISREEYCKALEEDGPLAAALTSPMGDGCNIL